MAKDDRIVFVIDEFPYLAKAAPSISSKLQHLIDHKWSETKLYLILCGSSMSFMENLFERSGYLYEEPENLLKQESPITEKQEKKTIYLIADNFFRFWYRFVPQHVAAISAGRFQQLYNNAVKARLNEYMGLIFEKMCKEYLLYYAVDTPFLLNQIGQWWGNDLTRHKEIQVDIVAPSEDEKKFIIGSCKFRNQPVGMEELELLKYFFKERLYERPSRCRRKE